MNIVRKVSQSSNDLLIQATLNLQAMKLWDDLNFCNKDVCSTWGCSWVMSQLETQVRYDVFGSSMNKLIKQMFL